MIFQVVLILLIEFTLSQLHKQVYPSCLVNIERDYLSIDKRYPRLFISPEFSKVHTDIVCLSGNSYYWGGNPNAICFFYGKGSILIYFLQML